VYDLQFAAGDYEYHFECSDGEGGSDRFPFSGEESLAVSDSVTNTTPTLIGAAVSPSTGTTNDSYKYRAGYDDDDDGDPPYEIWVSIDGKKYDLSLYAGSPDKGWYETNVPLTAGTHYYYYYCSDGLGAAAQSPTSGAYSGPTVSSASGKRAYSGLVYYVASEQISETSPLVVEVYSTSGDGWNLVDSKHFIKPVSIPYNYDYYFSFELEPGTYYAIAYVDKDNTGDISEGDEYTIYNQKHLFQAYDQIDLTSSDFHGIIYFTDGHEFGFYQDFSTGIPADWTPSDDRWQVVNEKYTMSGTAVNGGGPGSGYEETAWTLYGEENITDFAFSVTTEQTQGDFENGDWGILFRFGLPGLSGIPTGYALWLDNDGWWGVNLIENDAELFTGPGFTPGDVVTVECVGYDCTVYINGTQTGKFNLGRYGSLNKYASGYVGLYAWDDSDESDENVFTFDDVWLIHNK
jgi:hypothetical protein